MTLNLKWKIIIGLLAVLTLLAALSSVWFWYKGQKPTITPGNYAQAPEVKEVIKIKRVEVPGPERIVTVEKEVVVERLSLPAWVRDNPAEQTIATAQIAPYRGTTSAVAVLNTETGRSQIIAKQDPLPLLAFVNDREIGVRAGLNLKGEPETTLYGRYDFVRIGRAHVGVYGEAASTGQAKAQLSIGFKF